MKLACLENKLKLPLIILANDLIIVTLRVVGMLNLFSDHEAVLLAAHHVLNALQIVVDLELVEDDFLRLLVDALVLDVFHRFLVVVLVVLFGADADCSDYEGVAVEEAIDFDGPAIEVGLLHVLIGLLVRFLLLVFH